MLPFGSKALAEPATASTGARIVGDTAMNESEISLRQAPGFPEWSDDKWSSLSQEEWKQRLPDQAFRVLRRHGTERSFSSPLNDEKGSGLYACAGCGLYMFSSEHKYDSGTGWPSFFLPIKGRYATSTDWKLIYPRTEYHCIRCKGHHGHVFNDGPEPTGKRWCNNGVALLFVPKTETG